jgi:hypothetical protein
MRDLKKFQAGTKIIFLKKNGKYYGLDHSIWNVSNNKFVSVNIYEKKQNLNNHNGNRTKLNEKSKRLHKLKHYEKLQNYRARRQILY